MDEVKPPPSESRRLFISVCDFFRFKRRRLLLLITFTEQ